MLKITASQMEALSGSRVDLFVHRLVARLREFFPETRVMSDQQIRELIQQGIERAAVYNITSERDVAKYVGLMVLWGRDFDKASPDSWIVSTLRSVALDPGYKLDCLYDHAAQGASYHGQQVE